jgi:hypothetical protein
MKQLASSAEEVRKAKSAGKVSPATIWQMSPIWRSAEGISLNYPSFKTFTT